ncbi:MAG TPA: RNA-binding domain-containing protein [Candidatus Bathyarchaeia archaeon]|nr:RNA-binding domain-containing protein [Candidatus Bathyarchaeia archaeon]
MIRKDNVNFSAAEIKIIVHATEETDSILKHLNSTLNVPPDTFSIEKTEGHWGNKIHLLTGILSKNEANSLYRKVEALLENYNELLSNFFDEKGNLYIRLDKQRLCRGKVSISESDSIRIRFRNVMTYGSCKSIIE